ncbi:MAG: RND family transporter, partial [Pseudomonadota bacterium]
MIIPFFQKRYRRCLEYPIVLIAGIVLACTWAITQLPKLTFDASSDSLVAQGDPELAYFRKVTEAFGEAPFLILTYTPNSGELLSRQHVDRLGRLVDELSAIDGVASVTSILDAPLLQSPPVPLSQLAESFRTVRSPDVDFVLARTELTESPLFSELLISTDGQATAIRINLELQDRLMSAKTDLDAARAGGDVDRVAQ